jgi:hypothetical protein
MGHSSEPGNLSNVFSSALREIGEFVINATSTSEVCSGFSDFKRIKLNRSRSLVHPNGDGDVI